MTVFEEEFIHLNRCSKRAYRGTPRHVSQIHHPFGPWSNDVCVYCSHVGRNQLLRWKLKVEVGGKEWLKSEEMVEQHAPFNYPSGLLA